MDTLSPIPAEVSGTLVGVRYGELIERRALRQPSRTALIFGGESLTYGELLDRILLAANRLTESGVQPGDRVVTWSENRPDVLIALYASSRVGAIFTPIGIAALPTDVAFILDDLAAGTLLVSERTAESVSQVPGVETKRILALGELAMAPSSPSSPPRGPAHVPTSESCALVVYTSGTSGHPKGVMLSHHALFANSINTVMGLDVLSDDVTLVSTPLSHVAALNTLAVTTLHKGGTVVIDEKFDPTQCLRQIRDHRVTTMFAVPSMLTMLAREPRFESADISSLRWILGGGAPMPPALVAQWSSRGVPVLASYGLTEAGPSVSFRRTGDAAQKSESSGSPALLTDIAIVGPTGADVPPGEVGEIHVRGPHIASGYWHNDLATDAAFRSGWLVTGDRGLIDADGDLCITGRSKDIIITGGENVDPAEVEHLLARHPDVTDVAVIGRPDPVWGEIVVVVVVADRSIDLVELQNFVRPHLAKYKIPRALEERKALPRNAVGKLLRRALTDQTELSG